MNKIQIEIYCIPRSDLKYHVRIPGFRDYKRFRTKKEAEKWVVEYRRFLNNNLRNVFSLNSSLSILYWEYFYEFDPYYLREFGNHINDLIERSRWIFGNHGEDYSHIPLNAIGSVYDIQHDFILKLKKISRRNKMYHLSNQVKSIIYQYNLYIDEFYDTKYSVEKSKKSLDTKVINLKNYYRIAE